MGVLQLLERSGSAQGLLDGFERFENGAITRMVEFRDLFHPDRGLGVHINEEFFHHHIGFLQDGLIG